MFVFGSSRQKLRQANKQANHKKAIMKEREEKKGHPKRINARMRKRRRKLNVTKKREGKEELNRR